DVAGRPLARVIISSGMATARADTVADMTALAVAAIGTAAMPFGARLLATRLAGHRPAIRGSTWHDWETSVMVEILQLAIMVCAGLLMLAVLQPFLQVREGVAIMILMASAV